MKWKKKWPDRRNVRTWTQTAPTLGPRNWAMAKAMLPPWHIIEATVGIWQIYDCSFNRQKNSRPQKILKEDFENLFDALEKLHFFPVFCLVCQKCLRSPEKCQTNQRHFPRKPHFLLKPNSRRPQSILYPSLSRSENQKTFNFIVCFCVVLTDHSIAWNCSSFAR